MCVSARWRSAPLRAHVIDVREEFARDFILPALQAGAVYEARVPLASALGRPLIAQASGRDRGDRRRHGGRARHAARGQRRSAPRTLLSARSIRRFGYWRRPRLGRDAEPTVIDYARERGIPVPVAARPTYSTDVESLGPRDRRRRCSTILAEAAEDSTR